MMTLRVLLMNRVYSDIPTWGTCDRHFSLSLVTIVFSGWNVFLVQAAEELNFGAVSQVLINWGASSIGKLSWLLESRKGEFLFVAHLFQTATFAPFWATSIVKRFSSFSDCRRRKSRPPILCRRRRSPRSSTTTSSSTSRRWSTLLRYSTRSVFWKSYISAPRHSA